MSKVPTSFAAIFLLGLVASFPALAESSGPSAGRDGKQLRNAGASESAETTFDVRWSRLKELLEKKDYDAAYVAVEAILEGTDFDTQSASRQHASYFVAGSLALELGRMEEARSHLRAAAALNDDNEDVTYWLSFTELALENPASAANYMAAFARRWPERLETIDHHHVDYILNALDSAQGDARTSRSALLEALFEADWKREAIGGADRIWYELALVRADADDIAGTRAALARLTTATEWVKVLADRRFDPARDGDAGDVNVRALADRKVASLRALSERQPRRLLTLTTLVDELLVTGQYDQAIAIVDAVRSTLDPAGDAASPYDDLDQLPWLLNQRSTALRRTGHVDQAVTELEAASRMDEVGQANVSQMLNLAQFYCSLGRPKEARAVIARVGDNLSGYGRMVRASAELRAALALDDAPAAEKAMDYLRAHRREGEPVYLDSLVEAGRMDEAAAVLIEQLQSTQTRDDALDLLQTLHEAPPLPGEQVQHRHWQQLKARSDVQAAAEAVGRILEHDIHR